MPRISLAVSNPTLLTQWHPTLNGTLTPTDVHAGTSRKVWWIDEFGHEWDASPGHRSAGQGCPICAGKRVIAGINDLTTIRPELAEEWHPTRNELRADQVTPGSGRRAWWLDRHGHEWESTINNRSWGTGCPICAGHQVLAGFNDLASRNPTLAAQWHPTRNQLRADQVTSFSGLKGWWLDAHGHEWESTIRNRAYGNGCPVCAEAVWIARRDANPGAKSLGGNRHRLPGVNDMAATHPELASEWHPSRNGQLTPSDVFAGTSRKLWWRDALGHEWEANGNSRLSGSGCPICAGQQVLAGFKRPIDSYPSAGCRVASVTKWPANAS